MIEATRINMPFGLFISLAPSVFWRGCYGYGDIRKLVKLLLKNLYIIVSLCGVDGSLLNAYQLFKVYRQYISQEDIRLWDIIDNEKKNT